MSTPLRIMLVDDSSTFRLMLARALDAYADITVVGHAANGSEALDRLGALSPDAVLLDLEMPVMDGLSCLRELRRRDRRLTVIMVSGTTERGARATLEALAAGANDYVTKPSAMQGINPSDYIDQHLVPKLRALSSRARATRTYVPPPTPTVTARALPRIEVVAIGASTGGPNALMEVVSRLPLSLPVPVLIVQHMPPSFTRQLAARLDDACALTVREGEADAVLRPGEVWIAPGGLHMKLARQAGQPRLALDSSPPENSCRPAVDVLLRSVAEQYGANVLAVILTGMGQDGLAGCRHCRNAGAEILAQDERSSVVWGMPGQVVRAGLADRILPIGEMSGAIVSSVARHRGPIARVRTGTER